MFEINYLVLFKMGWREYKSNYFNMPKFSTKRQPDDDWIRYYIGLEDPKEYYFIKELTDEEKQISNNLYKFVIGDTSIEFNSNLEMIKLIIQYEACNEQYKRHFKLIKILK